MTLDSLFARTGGDFVNGDGTGTFSIHGGKFDVSFLPLRYRLDV